MIEQRRARWLVVSCFALCAACQATPSAGTPCTRPADCAAPLTCAYGRCRAMCTSTRDCPVGAHCLVSSGVGSCSLDTDLGCESGVGRMCPSGLVCVADRCEQVCSATLPCATGSTCTPTGGGTSFCSPYASDAGAVDAPSASDAPSGPSPCDAIVDLTNVDAGAGTFVYRADTSSAPYDGVLAFGGGCAMATHVEHQVALRYRMRSTAYLVVDTANAYTLPNFDTIAGVFATCDAAADRLGCNDDIGADPRSHLITDGALAAGRDVIIGVGGYTMPSTGRVANGLLEVHITEVAARMPGEACDPTGQASICLGSGCCTPTGSGCVATAPGVGVCVQGIAEVEDNALATPEMIDVSQPVLVDASIDVASDEDCFAFDVTAGQSLVASISDGRGACPQMSAALDLTLHGPTGSVIATANGVVPNASCPTIDGSGSGGAHALTAGRYVLCVTPVMSVPFFGYDLGIAVVP